jgi:hypothetical protein
LMFETQVSAELVSSGALRENLLWASLLVSSGCQQYFVFLMLADTALQSAFTDHHMVFSSVSLFLIIFV